MIMKLITAIFTAIGGFFNWKASPSKQYSDARKSVEKDMKKREDDRQAVRDAVYGGDENRVNAMLNPAIAVLVGVCLLCGGCFTTTKVVRVTEDRYVSCVKGDDGKVLYWKVPPAIMVELLDAKCELEQYKKDKQINERLLK